MAEQLLSKLLAAAHGISDGADAVNIVPHLSPPEDPPPFGAVRLWKAERKKAGVSLEEAREMMAREISRYLHEEAPGYMLLVRLPPGTGKSYAGVKAADEALHVLGRGAYALPRHDAVAYIEHVANEAGVDIGDWYEWLPRQQSEDEFEHTCDFADSVAAWVQKGRPALDVCGGLCGWDAVNGGCRYHAQKHLPFSVAMIQHQHVVGGHPLMKRFKWIIGDESPLSSFLQARLIPATHIVPSAIDIAEVPLLFQVLAALRDVALGDMDLYGEVLWREVASRAGGIEALQELVQEINIAEGARLADKTPRSKEDIEKADYWFLPQLIPLMRREVAAVAEGRENIWRVGVRAVGGERYLEMLVRQPPAVDLPEHIIWLDATGREEIYKKLFQREVRILNIRPALRGKVYQVVNRLNNISSLRKGGDDITRQAEQAISIARRVEVESNGKFGVITFKALVPHLPPEWNVGHFYAVRGNNDMEGGSVLVIGAPMPRQGVVKRMAAQLFFEDDAPFDDAWYRKIVPINYVDEDGYQWGLAASGYWNDHRLQAVLETVREEELLQALHRSRPIVYEEARSWLLTNLPIPDVCINALLDASAIMRAPQGANPYLWNRLQIVLSGVDVVTAQWIADTLGVSPTTARKYLEFLAQEPEWEWETVLRRRGRPARGLRRAICAT